MKKDSSYDDLQARYAKLEAAYQNLIELLRHKDERIAYLERCNYGSKRDKRKQYNSDEYPSLFDDEFKKALDIHNAIIEKIAEQIEADSKAKRKKAKKPLSVQPNINIMDLRSGLRRLILKV